MTPSVTAIVSTHDRPQLLRRAVERIRAQRHDGLVKCVVVFDKTEPDTSLERDGDRPVQVMANTRTPGLAGGRNTGILASTTDYVGFCDDDDERLPDKAAAQVAALAAKPSARSATCGVEIRHGDRTTVRIPDEAQLTMDDFVCAFLEVYDRVDTRTLTGRLCRPLSDLFLLQWESQRELYGSGTVVGPVY